MASGLERLDPPRTLGRMQLLAQLGEGGMAKVFLATVGHGSLVRPAAVKLLRADAPDHDYRMRFLDEAKVVVRLHHNNLVDVREAGEIDGRLFIAMEMVEGRDLADVWDQAATIGRAIPVNLAVYTIREVLRGLHYAHSAPGLGLVHRDVSPSNVLIDWAGAVRLADFGLATSALKVSTTVPGVVFGKVGYMSPEQARHRPLDGRADVYACGVILWELLTGRPLRDAGCDTNAVARFEARAPSMLSHRVDAQLDAIVLKSLARRRDDRYESAEAFQNALTTWLTANAPGTNQDALATFMTELFGDVQDGERAAMRDMLERSAGPGRTLVFTSDSMPAAESATRSAPAATVSGSAPEADEEDETIPEGTIISERYRVLSRLGQGGMGTVYLGEHLTVGRSVAIKVLTRAWSANPAVARRFRAEARAASAAGHPNIVEVFDAGELPDGRLYLVMEFLTGRSLYAEIQAIGRMDVPRACRILRQIARAVRAAHGVGIIHRDLKPDNVMVVDRGEGESVKVLDFGVSAQTETSGERMTSAGQALGTPEYMAPEQARGEVPTPAIDIYAIGVLGYEMLAAEPPFVAESIYEVLARKTTEPAPSLASHRDDLPRELVGLIDDCLRIDPAARPESIDAFLERLDAVLRSLPREGVALPPGPAPRGSRLPWALAGAVVISGVAVAVALGGGTGEDGSGGSARAVSPPVAPVEITAHDATTREPATPEAGTGTGAATAEEPAATTAAPDPAPRPDPAPSAPARSDADPTGQTPPAPAPTNPAATPRCARIRKQAADAYDGRLWDAVVRHTRRRECFPDRAQLIRRRVHALQQSGAFEKCIREGEGSTDSKVRGWVRFCQARLDRG